MKKKKWEIIGIIPARMASSRFPGKPLALINGMPMIGHVYMRCKMSKILNEVYVATCDNEIADYIKMLGGRAVMTSKSHERASDRTAEALLEIEEEEGKTVDIVVMIQGDEPLINPEMLEESVQPMIKNESLDVVNLMSHLKDKEEHEDPNEVKVVVDQNNFALYFSREPIPSRKKGAKDIPMLKQVCVIPFRRDFLLLFNRLQPMPLEIAESVDMLRVLEHGHKVKMVLSEHQTYSVDTKEDLLKAEKIIAKDGLFKKYKIGSK
ncbi:3-deoxy-manno-octulosonate cytidylyltransferase [Candidatus Saganbacteria bacterium]|nr:3-deoxy-manno-octulosonate cytidylyltransferase [Candidatus Saganbacteria bacterium]